MDEYYEILTHIPLQYFENFDDTNICIIETHDNIYKEIQKYNIKNIKQIKILRTLNDLCKFEIKFNVLICEYNYNLTNEEINKLIQLCDIVILPEKNENINTIWRYFDWFNFNSPGEIICNYKYKIKINNNIINFYSNKYDALNYFLNFMNFDKLKINTKYYYPENHFKYFVETPIQKDKLIMGTHIMLDFDKVDFNLLEDIPYIKKMMNEIAIREKFIVLNTTFHKFEPQGFTMILLLSTSHFSIHTYPEHNKCSIDLYSCDMNVNYNNVINMLKKNLKSDNFKLHQVIRKI